MQAMEISKENFIQLLADENSRGLIVETLQEDENGKAILNQFAENHFEQAVKPKIGEIHRRYDEDFSGVLGVNKPDGVKSYEFWKSQLAELKEKANSSDSSLLEKLKNENTDLQGKIENNESAKHFKELYESAKITAEKSISEYEEKLQKLVQEKTQSKIKTELSTALAGFKFDENIKKPVLDTYVANVVSTLTKNAKVQEDGSVTYYDDNGTILTNSRTMNKKTASEILNDSLKDVLFQDRSSQGGGGNTSESVKKKGFASAKNQGELIDLITENLLADGLTKGTKQFQEEMNKLFSENGKGLPLR